MEMAERYSAELSVPTWAQKLVFSKIRRTASRYGRQRDQAGILTVGRACAASGTLDPTLDPQTPRYARKTSRDAVARRQPLTPYKQSCFSTHRDACARPAANFKTGAFKPWGCPMPRCRFSRPFHARVRPQLGSSRSAGASRWRMFGLRSGTSGTGPTPKSAINMAETLVGVRGFEPPLAGVTEA
jgi:hypothetical protein